MLFTRLVRRNRRPTEANARVLVGIVVAMVAIAIIVQFVNWLNLGDRSLLNQTPGLVTPESTESLGITPPTELFSSELFEIGLYTQSSDAFPANTVSLVYVKNNWRFVEIDYLPGRTMVEQRAIYRTLPQEEAMVDDKTYVFVTLDRRSRCIEYDDDIPNRCELTRQLLVETETHLIMISADGTHATDGELLLMAKSIMEQESES